MMFTKSLLSRPFTCKRLTYSYLNSANRYPSRSCSNQSNSENWFNKLLTVRNIEPRKKAHSKLLSDSDNVYELQIHNVKPGHMKDYLKNCENLCNLIKTKEPNADLVASLKVLIGDQDQVVNIWRFTNGYVTANKIFKLIHQDESLIKLFNDQGKLLRKRENQFMLAFSFWGDLQPVVRNCNYELRSYVLKPGTMIEWANYWAKGITFRQNKVAGFFSQIGQLYVVHHLWHYDSFQDRKDVRENAWRKPGWDEVVAYTVPLMREMHCRWLIGNTFSPLR